MFKLSDEVGLGSPSCNVGETKLAGSHKARLQRINLSTTEMNMYTKLKEIFTGGAPCTERVFANRQTRG